MASEAMVLVLSKYERVQIVAARVEQLLDGAPRLVEGTEGMEIEDIAELEVSKRVLPLRIARTLPNGKRRVFDLADFIDPKSEDPAVHAHGTSVSQQSGQL